MDEQTLDLIYDNAEVASVAVLNYSGNLLENHLPVLESELSVVIGTVFEIYNGFNTAGRQVLGFVLKSDRMTLLISFFEEAVVIIEVVGKCSLNALDKKLRSTLGSLSLAPATRPVITSQITDAVNRVTPITRPITSSVAQVTPAVTLATVQQGIGKITPQGSGEVVDVSVLRTDLVKLLKKVAPGGLAEKMVNDAFALKSVDLESTSIDKLKALEVGHEVVNKIPNKSRRKMIAKEFEVLAKSF